MRFMSLWRPAKSAMPPSPQALEQLGKLVEEMGPAMVLTGGWDPTGPATIVASTQGKITVTDGPFTESKELIAGFAILECASKEEATKWSKRYMSIIGDGTCETRELGTPH